MTQENLKDMKADLDMLIEMEVADTQILGTTLKTMHELVEAALKGFDLELRREVEQWAYDLDCTKCPVQQECLLSYDCLCALRGEGFDKRFEIWAKAYREREGK
jgi:hypothetical protein